MPRLPVSLPARPSLENLRKQAKTLLKQFRTGDPDALAEVRRHLSRLKKSTAAELLATPLTLNDAQWIVAKHYGFASWPQLKAHVDALQGKIFVSPEVSAVARLHRDLFDDTFRTLPIREQLDRQAHRIVEAHRAGDRAVIPHICCWLPGAARKSGDEIMQLPLTLADARTAIAREYGFHDWPAVLEQGAAPPDATFEAAVDAVLAGDVAALRKLLREHPELARARSSYGHRATLLHYVAANGVETQRQVVPVNAAQVVNVLLAASADVNATAAMYGGGSTPLGLLVTSAHPARAGQTEKLAALLRAAGATETAPPGT